jgi:hypothetical protein
MDLFWNSGFWRAGFWVNGFWSGLIDDESAGPIRPGLVLAVVQYPSVTVELPQEASPVS